MICNEYELYRSARKTISISIKDGKIIVRCPLRTPIKEVEKFVKSKEGWISRHLGKDEWLSDVINYEFVLVKGQKIPLITADKNVFSSQLISVRSLSSLKKLFIDNLGEEFISLFKSVSEQSNLKYNSVSFKSYKSRWGCCDREGNIIFNYKLLMLPTYLWGSVMVHELCHTKVMNHSKRFYDLVERVMPDYKKVNSNLKKFSRICSLY